jgi:hypothetical protein
VLGGRDQARHVSRRVAEVGVHLEDQVRSTGEGVPEPGEVGNAEPALIRPVENLDRVDLARKPVGDPSRSVGGVVVDDQDPVRGRGLGELRQHRADERRDVDRLVVGGEDQPGAGHGRLP